MVIVIITDKKRKRKVNKPYLLPVLGYMVGICFLRKTYLNFIFPLRKKGFNIEHKKKQTISLNHKILVNQLKILRLTETRSFITIHGRLSEK